MGLATTDLETVGISASNRSQKIVRDRNTHFRNRNFRSLKGRDVVVNPTRCKIKVSQTEYRSEISISPWMRTKSFESRKNKGEKKIQKTFVVFVESLRKAVSEMGTYTYNIIVLMK